MSLTVLAPPNESRHVTVHGVSWDTYVQLSDEIVHGATLTNSGTLSASEEFDGSIHPPPDLAIEVDLSPPDVAKTPIYAALGVTEIWRYTPENGVEIFLRSSDGSYRIAEMGAAFPVWPAAVVNKLLTMGLRNQSAAVAELRRRI